MRSRSFLLGLMAMAVTGIIQAQDLTDGRMKLCKSLSEMAGSIMKGRQGGVEMAAMMEVKQEDADVTQAARKIVVQAFEQPRYATKPMQEKAVVDFKNDQFLSCVKSS